MPTPLVHQPPYPPGGASIRAIRNPWRDRLFLASFRGRPFFTDTRSIEGGRRIVHHQFPKKDEPFAEDMGRRAWTFTMRAYFIQSGRDQQFTTGFEWPIYMRDYCIPRDNLLQVLDDGKYGELRSPNFPAHMGKTIVVACDRYRLTEEEKLGGYCVIDMTFVEGGVNPNTNPGKDKSGISQKIDAAFKAITFSVTDQTVIEFLLRRQGLADPNALPNRQGLLPSSGKNVTIILPPGVTVAPEQ